MKAIQIRYLGPTNTKPARVKVFAKGMKSVILPDGFYGFQDDVALAMAVGVFFRRNKVGPWTAFFTFGTLPNGDRVAVPYSERSTALVVGNGNA